MSQSSNPVQWLQTTHKNCYFKIKIVDTYYFIIDDSTPKLYTAEFKANTNTTEVCINMTNDNVLKSDETSRIYVDNKAYHSDQWNAMVTEEKCK